MLYQVQLEGFEGQTIQVQPAGAFSSAKLLVDGQPAARGTKRGEMILQRTNGQPVTASWKPKSLGLDLPQLIVDGQVIEFVKPLKWYELVWSGLPILLTVIGGALGAVAGVIGFSISAKVFRSNMNGVLKYVLSGVVSVLVALAYIILATAFLTAMGR